MNNYPKDMTHLKKLWNTLDNQARVYFYMKFSNLQLSFHKSEQASQIETILKKIRKKDCEFFWSYLHDLFYLQFLNELSYEGFKEAVSKTDLDKLVSFELPKYEIKPGESSFGLVLRLK